MIAPIFQHIRDQYRELPGPVGHVGCAAEIGITVTGMGQGGSHEPSLGQGFGRIEMAPEKTTMAMRHDHQRQMIAHQRGASRQRLFA